MNTRRALLLVILLLTLAGLGLALWWSYRPVSSSANASAPKISPLEPARVTRIRVRHGADQIVIQRDAPGTPWHLTRPVNAPVDTPHLAAVLSLLANRAQRRYTPGAIDSATTGLKSPRLVVQFNQQSPIDIGGPGPSRGSRYVGTAHDLLLADLPDLGGLDWGWTHWISPALIPPHRRLSKLILPRFTLSRGADDHWQAAPAGQRSAAAVDATMQAWARVRALSVVPADDSAQRLARITLIFAHGKPRHLDIIQRNPNLILRDPALGVDYHLAGNRIGPLLEIRHPGL